MSTSCSFSSSLGPVITSYLALKKALGRCFANETNVLAHFDRFLVAQPADSRALAAESFAAWSLTLAHLTPTTPVPTTCSTCRATSRSGRSRVCRVKTRSVAAHRALRRRQ
jgi:hypothetical protein